MGAVILIILALISINMVILLIAGWILAYIDIFFLGFGGSRWTSEIAINYYKTVLGITAEHLAKPGCSLYALAAWRHAYAYPQRLGRSMDESVQLLFLHPRISMPFTGKI